MLASAAAQPSDVLLVACGDVVFDRGVAKVCKDRGTDWPLAAVTDTLSSADIAFVNLESPLSNSGARIPGKGIWFRSDPCFGEKLATAGIDVVSLANNHILDYGESAFSDTVDVLRANGIAGCGGGADMWEARRPVLLRKNGITFAFLGYSEFAEIYWSVTHPVRFLAGVNKPGVAPANAAMVSEDVARAKRIADHVVVSFHWGDEYVHMPADRQVSLAHTAIDAGASLAIGHHPHVLQPVEVYHGGIIFYSLGNFVFDQKKPDTVESMMARVAFSRDRVSQAEAVPVRIEECRPRPLTAWAARIALWRLSRWSASRGTDILNLSGRGVIMLPRQAAAAEAQGLGKLLP